MSHFTKIITAIALVVVFTGCSISRQATGIRQKINGNWMLQTISTEGITGKVTAVVFNEASFNCFVGSSWNFSSGNSLGNYNINTSGKECTGITRQIRWSIYEPKDAIKEFQFKRLDDKRKPVDGDEGFRLEIASLDANSMQLKSHFQFEGKPATYVYNFVKK